MRERERELSTSTSFSLPKLLRAYLACRRRKRKTVNALKFEINCENELALLQQQLRSRTYQPGRSVCFAVTHPKLREVFASTFRDRVVHHLLVNEIEPHFDRRFVFDSYACRKNKGCHLAIARLRQFLRKITANGSANAYYGQFDIRSFFINIDKNILYAILSKEIKKSFPLSRVSDLLWLAHTIIFHNPAQNFYYKGDKRLIALIPPHKTLFNAPENKGLPIGNLTSQFFANVYLNQLDQFIKRTLKVKYYLRYVDDIVVLAKNPEQIKRWRDDINAFLAQNLKLALHPDKDKYGSVFRGIDYIGYVVKPGYVLSRNRVVQNLKAKLHCLNKGVLLTANNQKQLALPLSKPLTEAQLQQITATINSYYGHFRRAACFNLRKNLYEKHFGVLKQYLDQTDNYRYFTRHVPTK